MNTKEIVKAIKEVKGQVKFKEAFNQLYSDAGMPTGDRFTSVVQRAILIVVPSLQSTLTSTPINNSTANAVAAKLVN